MIVKICKKVITDFKVPCHNFRLEINWIGYFEHGGTHMDAPAHYAQGRAHLHEVPAEQFFGPGVMIDMTRQAKTSPDYLMTIKDIQVSI